jgi:uncharacterized protein YxjI
LLGGDAWIEDGLGRRAFRVDGARLRGGCRLVIEDVDGRLLYSMLERTPRIRDTLEIESDVGVVARIEKSLVAPLREHFVVEFDDAPAWQAEGSIGEREYRIDRPGRDVAGVSHRWFRANGSFGVKVALGQDAALVLMVAIAIDQLANPDR